MMKKKEWVEERISREYYFGKISRKTYEEKKNRLHFQLQYLKVVLPHIDTKIYIFF